MNEEAKPTVSSVGSKIQNSLKRLHLSQQDTDHPLFYSWECVSLVRKEFTTLDLVIKDMNELLCLIHVVHSAVYTPDDQLESENVNASTKADLEESALSCELEFF